MEQLQEQFQFGNKGIRVQGTPEEPWFVVKDVCSVLNIKNHRQILTYLDDDEKGVISSDTLGGQQSVTAVNEYGLYALIIRSRKPEARKFKRWITHEVIPTIRKYGGYLTPEKTEEILNDPDTMIKLLQDLKEERNRRQVAEEKKEELSNHNQKLLPKAEYHDEVLSSRKLMPVKIIAKELGTGPRILNRFLHTNGVIYKQGEVWYLYYKYQDKGYARYGTYKKLLSNGDVATYHYLKWTEKGRQFIHQLWNKTRDSLPGWDSAVNTTTK